MTVQTHLVQIHALQDFCTYDDYNWDWTLNSLGSKCFKKSWKVLKMVAARVSHIGAW